MRDANAAAGGDVQDEAGGFYAVAGEDDAGGGAARAPVDQAQQLCQRGSLRAGGVDQQEVAGPRVVAKLGGGCEVTSCPNAATRLIVATASLSTSRARSVSRRSEVRVSAVKLSEIDASTPVHLSRPA